MGLYTHFQFNMKILKYAEMHNRSGILISSLFLFTKMFCKKGHIPIRLFNVLGLHNTPIKIKLVLF